MPQEDERSVALSKHLRANIPRILSDWETELRQKVPAAQGHSAPALRNSIPRFLGNVAEALHPHDPRSRACDDNTACYEHGKERAEMEGYTLGQIIQEYQLLRRIVFRILEEQGPLRTQERNCILDSIEQGINDATTEFARIAEMQARRQKEAVEAQEALLRAILASAPFGIGFLDRQFRYLRINEPLAQMNGLPAEEHLGKTIYEVLPQDSRRIEPILRRILETREPITNLEFDAETPPGSGKQRSLLCAFYPVFATDKGLIGFGVAATDITERKAIEDRLRSVLERLEEEKVLRERFVSSLTHDLRTPLTTVRVSAELIRRHPEKVEKHAALLNRVITNVERMDRMIQDLLDAILIKAGERPALHFAECDLRALAEDVISELSLTHGDRFVFDAESDVIGFWSCEGLRRIIDNLAKNAVKYGAPDQPVTISLRWVGDVVRVSVHNEGEPIPLEEQATLFEPFKRGHAAKLSGRSGWGIGLTLVRGIAEAHSGKARIDSSSERGTTFTVELPRDVRGTPARGGT